MAEWIQLIFIATLAGITIPLGGFLAKFENIRPQWLEAELRHSIIAFGGGALLAAIAFVLVPEGIKHLPVWAVIVCFSLGGVCFMIIDRYLASRGGSWSQLMAMLLDFIPEAMALGAMLTSGVNTAYLLAFLIGLQNLPEAFNAYREIIMGDQISSKKVLGFFTLLVLLGPISAAVGMIFLSTYLTLLAIIMIFSSGGILYLIFQDIAPQVKLKRHWGPPFGAVCGFLFGIVGHMIIH